MPARIVFGPPYADANARPSCQSADQLWVEETPGKVAESLRKAVGGIAKLTERSASGTVYVNATAVRSIHEQ